MDKEKAREILGSSIWPDGNLHGDRDYLDWKAGDNTACLDGHFGADELEAIAWWMRNAQGKEVKP